MTVNHNASLSSGVMPVPWMAPQFVIHQVIPNFREAAAAKLGERWASTPEYFYAPGGSTSSSLSSTVENRVPNGNRTNDTGQQERYPTIFRTTTPRADAAATISRRDNPAGAHPVVAFAPAFGTSGSTDDHAEGVVGDVVSRGRGGKVQTAHDRRPQCPSDGTRSVSTMPEQGGWESVVDCVEAVEANRPVDFGASKETPAAIGDAEMYEVGKPCSMTETEEHVKRRVYLSSHGTSRTIYV